VLLLQIVGAFVKFGEVIQDCLQEVWLDQEDAALLKEGEEVTLMDWGNAVIKVYTCPVDPQHLDCLCTLDMPKCPIPTPASLVTDSSFRNLLTQHNTTQREPPFPSHMYFHDGECATLHSSSCLGWERVDVKLLSTRVCR